jgi:Leucine-rich repeat (LRR) protein
MSGKSVSRGKMRIFRVLFIFSLLIHCLSGSGTLNYNCGDNHSSNKTVCVIEATFGNVATNETVDVQINCANDVELSNQFSKIERISWTGCRTTNELKRFGLMKIPFKTRVKYLKIENFAAGVLQAGTFDGFSGLEELSLRRNSIANLSASCFRDLKSLTILNMMENDLKWMEIGVLGDLAKLRTLNIHDSRLLIANHQFQRNQIVDNVELEIYYIEMDLLEHLFLHVRNLSISLKFKDDHDDEYEDKVYGCEQTRLNGYEKDWIIESLSMKNVRCGFILENVESVKSLSLNRAMLMKFAEFELRNVANTEEINLHENVFGNFSNFKLEGSFDKLKLLNLSNNGIKDINMRMFETFANMKKLDLTGNLLSKLNELMVEKFEKVEIFVDGNIFECSWLSDIASREIQPRFVHENNFKTLNINGLVCQQNNRTNEASCSSHFIDSVNNKPHWEFQKLQQENFVLRPEIFSIILCAFCLLGAAVTFISIYLYRKRQTMLKQKPFYHLLRASIIRPRCDVQSTLRRDLKEIIFRRNLPPCNYEHPISDSSNVTEMSEVAVNENNIYEEIPPKEEIM